MKKLQLLAPAKVNYRLDVLGKRPDGYHELRMIMQRVDLCDEIEIALSDSPGIRVTCGRKGVPDGPGNIAWRAADALLKLSDKEVGIEITIAKKIPVGAGLGGGSSDAATVLMGVNELLELGLTDERLMEIGVKLGADVPFFVFKKPALAEGIGDRLTALEEVPSLWVVLVNPGIHVSTAWVYQNLRLTTPDPATIIPRSYSSLNEVCELLSNDLEPVTCGRFPLVSELKEVLLTAGARGSLMSGSGSTVFGLFESESAARHAAAEIAKARGWFAAAVRTI
ncbi:4-diphosphocytidyl-2-C-methyl-D-erythritol kinase [Citrifermentans bemidjiense Bem]|uniref:4-diphosphocytidyl-2-C-methyl-D-erythritol kinase n=1 Tax=Citrifermentans bemidjiense (strain ATCC BAA-1014 / DSM 16622 / JCM 12645 / Bem) TaxID=404380 RepID=ISPE_CITBB|nr:4-(cytidine 5'-diphospho)-2-C-methyl-D-erythritol kinase [Citrifermentans bemidjiense]B5EHY0.1 RecName: Full=4-diphosphocytidyl-2-C-methyl-D-erythritol kinase; Short=CMK; AltName: Full=4-(cytidine-5'-diphospho)-2-C-methyl-D-erythritol kinase [Citrifermentans bemidjiense Bem]ACH39779.1 4-diphosphocytidyl-2-C-methyl-D-erythritol kinase [Citrifermentans bemidjiense Bem]